MRLLLDTNIFLELLLSQEKADEAKDLLSRVEDHTFFVSDYSVHSVGVLLFRRNRHDVFVEFLQDMILRTGVTVLSVDPQRMIDLVQAARAFRLDFDDAYQYLVAKQWDLTLVSLDGDFDRTDRGRRTPAEIA